MEKKEHSAGDRNVMRFYTMPAGAAKRGRIAAWLVHLYTASGAIVALAGVEAAFAGNARLAFAAMYLATIVDATDGVLARRACVKDLLPHIDGARIDDLVDYITFVFFPMIAALRFGMLPPSCAFAIAGLVLVCSMYGFVAPDAKTADHFFTGFPSYWNIVVVYLYVLGTSQGVNAAVLSVLCGLIFVRIGYVYPSRTPVLMRTTLALGAVWAAILAAMIWRLPSRAPSLTILSLVFPVYYCVLSLALELRRPA
jgi:phosphatidylcholine synthase